MKNLVQQSEERFRGLFEQSNDAIFIHDFKGDIFHVNKQACNLLGYTCNELCNMSIGELYPKSFNPDFNIIKAKNNIRLETQLVKKDGSKIDIEVSASIIDQEKGIVQGSVRDITERKKAEEKIKVSLDEKEVLLHEINHRFKNNLQTLMSLISIEKKASVNKEVIKVLDNCKTKLSAIALIHEQLIQDRSFANINMGNFLRKLLKNIVCSSKLVLSTEVKIDNINFPASTATHCAMIVNELITNCIKYAFKGRKEGKIKISLTKLKDQTILLSVDDNGRGLPKRFNLKKNSRTGLNIVKILAEIQLQGNFKIIDTGKGTRVSVVFRQILN